MNNLGEIGVIKDIDPHELPDNAWSDSRNVNFRNGRVIKSPGYVEPFTPSIAPYWLLPVPQPGAYYWIYAGLNKVYVTDMTSHYNITRQTTGVDVNYAATADSNWSGCILGGLPVLNNGIDDPQMWPTVSTSTKLTSLTWDASNTWAAKVYKASCIRAIGPYGVALGFNDGTTTYSDSVLWSEAATAGGVPSTWDYTDATHNAGLSDPLEGAGQFIDCLPMRDTNILYGSGAVWGMTPTGTSDIFRFYRIFEEIGIFSKRCIKEFKGNHFVFANGDVVVHDGVNAQSILKKRIRDWIYQTIDNTYYGRSFVVPNYAQNEMWACFPQNGATFPNIAVVWNWVDNTTQIIDIPSTPHIGYGVVDPGSATTWATLTTTWATATKSWDTQTYNPTSQDLLITDATNTKLYQYNNTEQANGANITCYVERTGISFQDIGDIKLVKRLWPKITGTQGGVVNVYIGSQMIADGPIRWTKKTFTIGTDKYVTCLVKGRYIAVKFESTSNITWNIGSYDLEVTPAGKY